MTHLKMSYRKRNHLRLSILTLSEKLISDIIDIDNLNNSKAVKWPLLVCIPQRSAVEREQEKNVIVKWTNDQQNRNWMSERPLAVNKDYSDRILSLKVRFNEVNILCYFDFELKIILQLTSHTKTGRSFSVRIIRAWFQTGHRLDHIWFPSWSLQHFAWLVWSHTMVRLWWVWSGSPGSQNVCVPIIAIFLRKSEL